MKECAVLEESAVGNFFNRRPQGNSVSNDILSLQQLTSDLSSTVAELQKDNQWLQTELQQMKAMLRMTDRSSTMTQNRMDKTLEVLHANANETEEQLKVLGDAFLDFIKSVAHGNTSQ